MVDINVKKFSSEELFDAGVRFRAIMLLLLCLLLPHLLLGQKPLWTTFSTINSALPSDIIRCIAFDAQNNAWIGTKGGGVAKFDGTNWTVFDTHNSALPDSEITAIVVDPQNYLWIGTNHAGLEKFTGTAWSNYNTSNSKLPADLITDLQYDPQGYLWIATQGGGIAWFDGFAWTIFSSSNSNLTDDYVYSLALDSQGNIWAGTYNTLAKFDGTSWSVLPIGAGFYCFDLVVDTEGTVWAASPGGLRKIEWPNQILYDNNNSGLPFSAVDAVALDAQGTVWAGTAGGGLASFDGTNWTVFNTGNSGLPHNKIDALVFGEDGKLWIGTNGGGLAIYQPESTPPAYDVNLLWRYTGSAAIKWFDRWEDGFATGDLNNDGIPDIVLGTDAGEAVAINGSNGTQLWSYQLSNTSESVNADIFDVDGDGVLEVIAGGKASSGNADVVVLENDGTLKWQQSTDYQEVTDFAYGDINGDGIPNIAAAIGTYSHSGGQVILFDGRDGTRIWTASLGSGTAFGIDARDVNGDGDIEVAVTNYDNKLFLIDGKSDSVLWSKSGDYYGRDVIIRDVDGDAEDEIVSVMGQTFCYSSSGELKWSIANSVGENLKTCVTSNEGTVKLLIADPWNGKTSLVDATTGTVLWTVSEGGAADVGDLDGDGLDEIVAATQKIYSPDFASHSVSAFDRDGTLLWKYDLDREPSAVIVANIDIDAEKEVIVAIDSTLLALDVHLATSVPAVGALTTPTSYRLYQNYPNPFNPTTTIRYELPKPSHVRLIIYDLLGRRITTLVNSQQAAGHFSAIWSGTDDRNLPIATGMYFCRLEAGEFAKVIKLLLVK
jgi:outer membrane protein assembly factor BamB